MTVIVIAALPMPCSSWLWKRGACLHKEGDAPAVVKPHNASKDVACRYAQRGELQAQHGSSADHQVFQILPAEAVCDVGGCLQ